MVIPDLEDDPNHPADPVMGADDLEIPQRFQGALSGTEPNPLVDQNCLIQGLVNVP